MNLEEFGRWDSDDGNYFGVDRSSGWALTMDASVMSRSAIRRLYPNNTRASRRTDFCRPGRMRFFARGRSFPTKAHVVGLPRVYEVSVGQHVGTGYVVAINIPKGTFWVTP